MRKSWELNRKLTILSLHSLKSVVSCRNLVTKQITGSNNQALINRGSLTFWIDEEAISEWKVKKHGTDGKRRVWRKLHLAVDTNTHEIIAAELSLSTVTDAEVLPNLLKQTRRKILEISGDGAYDTRDYHNAIYIKRAVALIPPREGATFWERGHPRNLAVGCQKLYGSNKYWKERYGYHKRSLSETAMYRVKQLLGGRLSLRNYNAQVGETYAMIKVLNKVTGLGMPQTCRIG